MIGDILYTIAVLLIVAIAYGNRLDSYDREQRRRRAEPLPLTEIYWRRP